MPKKAAKSQAKSKSQERREAVQSAAPAKKMKTYSAADARAANNNGKIKDREIIALEYPDDHVPMIGFGAFVRGEFFVRQAELPSDDAAAEDLGHKQYDALVALLKTVKDPE